jgi:hypothetical protein
MDAGFTAGGYPAAMRRGAERLVALRAAGAFIDGVRISQLYMAAGDTDQALAWLDRAAAAGNPNIPYIGVAQAYQELHGLPRCQALLDRVGIEAHVAPPRGENP